MASTETGTAARRPGRPRDTELHDRVLDAVNELLDEGTSLTVTTVVERSGVSRAAIYRRWETLDKLIAAALDVGREIIRIPEDLTAREALAYGLPVFGKKRVHEVTESRLKQRLQLALADPKLQREYWTGHVSRRRMPLMDHLRRGQIQGEIRADADLEAALDLLSGVFYYQVVARGESLANQETLERCHAAIEIIWQGIMADTPTKREHS